MKNKLTCWNSFFLAPQKLQTAKYIHSHNERSVGLVSACLPMVYSSVESVLDKYSMPSYPVFT